MTKPVSGNRAFTSARSAIPSRPGSFQSERTRSTGAAARSASAASTEPASATEYPSPRRIPATSVRWSISSSTTRSRASGTPAPGAGADLEERARPARHAPLEDEAPAVAGRGDAVREEEPHARAGRLRRDVRREEAVAQRGGD